MRDALSGPASRPTECLLQVGFKIAMSDFLGGLARPILAVCPLDPGHLYLVGTNHLASFMFNGWCMQLHVLFPHLFRFVMSLSDSVLPAPHQAFYRFYHGKARSNGRNVVVCGSVPLQQALVNRGVETFVANDVDFFTNMPLPTGREIMRFIREFKEQHDYKIGLGLRLLRNAPHYSANHVLKILDFTLHVGGRPTRHNAVGQPAQLVFLYRAESAMTDEAFAASVVGNFDVSVCRVAMIDPCDPLSVSCTDLAEAGIENMTMEYDMSKCTKPVTVWYRVKKYKARGFHLCSLHFDPVRVFDMCLIEDSEQSNVARYRPVV